MTQSPLNDHEIQARLLHLLDENEPPPLSNEATLGHFSDGRAGLELCIVFTAGVLTGVVLREKKVLIPQAKALRIVRHELTARARRAGAIP